MNEEHSKAPLWTGQDMADAMNARPVNGLPGRVEGISIDSRTIGKGDAFFAIAGENFDGHSFASKAAANGASVLVVAEGRLPMLGHLTVPLMVVDDVLEALRRLARAARARSKARIVAVTGSAGKTTTKEALRHVLSAQGATHASPASFNNHWGVPLTLARMPEDTRFGVFEIGMNHHGEITPLVKLVRPHVSMITLIAGAHLGHFKDLDDIAKAKAEIFSGLVSGGTALINRDDVRFNLLADMAREQGVENILGYGSNKQADIRMTAAKYLEDCSTFAARVRGVDAAVKVGMAGAHIALNCLGVLGVVSLLGADVEKAAVDLAHLSAGAGRGERHKIAVDGGHYTLIDETYNANVASIEAALATLATVKPEADGRRIVVLGDMFELGDKSAAMHAGLVEPLAKHKFDLVLLCGAEMKALDDALSAGSDCAHEHFATVDALQEFLVALPRNGDVIMAKSSNGMGFSRVVKALIAGQSTASDQT